MKSKSFYSYSAISLISLFMLVGCGGSNNTTTEVEEPLNGVKVNGIAVDDLIVNGIVKVYSTSNPPKLLGEGRTDGNDGSYTLNIDYDGVVVLEVTCDASSQMKNPTTGATKSCEDDLALESAAALSEDTKEVEVNISPVTHLVVQQMKERAGEEEVSKEDLELSQDNVGQIFGFDPLGDSPVENDNYKKTVDSIGDLAEDKNMTMMEVVDLINEDTVDGKSGDDGEVSAELANVMEENGVKNTFTENDGEVTPTEVPTSAPSAVPSPVPSAVPSSTPTEVPDEGDVVAPPAPTPVPSVETDIATSKAFFDDLRTQAMSVVDYNDSGTPGFLDTESEKLGQDLENMSLNIGLAADYSVGIVDLVTKSVDEGLDSKKKDIDNEDEDSDNSTKQMQKSGEPTVSRTLEVTKTSDAKVWTYRIEDNTSVVYEGKVTLPEANVSSITASNFTALTAKFEGKLPLRDIDSTELAGEQTVKLNLEVKKSAEGADIELKELSIKNGTDTVVVKTLKGKAEYDHNTDTDEVTIKSVTLDTITLEATLADYAFKGKLDIDYVTNTSIAGNGFHKDEYKTRIDGQWICVGEHNEYIYQDTKNMDGNVIYVDKSAEEHSIAIRDYGYFYDTIEGNVQNLIEGERLRRNAYEENNYTSYLGLNFDNIEISSPSCSNVILEGLSIYVHKNEDNQTSTNINTRIFCVDSNGNKSNVTDATVSFTDAKGIVHTVENIHNNSHYTNYHTSYEGNSEDITFDSGSKTFHDQDFETFDRVAVSNVNSECADPSLEYVSIGFFPRDDNKSILNTYVHGKVICADGSYASTATVVYTDKSNQTHDLIYDAEREFFHSDPNNRIEGNVEELPVNSGDKYYHAIGFVLPTTPMFSVTESSCANPKLTRYTIQLDKDGGQLYNSGVVPKKATFVGNLKNTKTSGEINAEINVDWKNAVTMDLTKDSEDKAELDVSLKGKIKMPNRPEMILNLGFDSSEASNKYNLSYQYDTTVLNGKATFTDPDDENGTVEFTGTSGIKLLVKVENGETLYGADSPVTRNGRKIGELQERDDVPVIKYVDGSFESLP